MRSLQNNFNKVFEVTYISIIFMSAKGSPVSLNPPKDPEKNIANPPLQPMPPIKLLSVWNKSATKAKPCATYRYNFHNFKG